MQLVLHIQLPIPAPLAANINMLKPSDSTLSWQGPAWPSSHWLPCSQQLGPWNESPSTQGPPHCRFAPQAWPVEWIPSFQCSKGLILNFNFESWAQQSLWEDLLLQPWMLDKIHDSGGDWVKVNFFHPKWTFQILKGWWVLFYFCHVPNSLALKP